MRIHTCVCIHCTSRYTRTHTAIRSLDCGAVSFFKKGLITHKNFREQRLWLMISHCFGGTNTHTHTHIYIDTHTHTHTHKHSLHEMMLTVVPPVCSFVDKEQNIKVLLMTPEAHR